MHLWWTLSSGGWGSRGAAQSDMASYHFNEEVAILEMGVFETLLGQLTQLTPTLDMVAPVGALVVDFAFLKAGLLCGCTQ